MRWLGLLLLADRPAAAEFAGSTTATPAPLFARKLSAPGSYVSDVPETTTVGTYTGPLPDPIDVWRSRPKARKTCTGALGQPHHWGTHGTEVWDDFHIYQKLAFELLGWNQTMWDEMEEYPSEKIWIWTDEPVETTTTAPTTVDDLLELMDGPSGGGGGSPGGGGDASGDDSGGGNGAADDGEAGGDGGEAGGADDAQGDANAAANAADGGMMGGMGGGRRLRGDAEERRLDMHGMLGNWSNGTNGTNGSGAYAMLVPEEPTTTSTTTTPYPGRRFDAMCFFDLGVEQQMAIFALGYTIDSWNCMQPCPLYEIGKEQDGSGMGQCHMILDELRAYHNREYHHLTPREKENLDVLGVTKADWKKGDWLDTARGKWDDRNEEEMQAAAQLGFSMMTWNRCRDWREDGKIVMEKDHSTPKPPPPKELDPLRPVFTILTLKKQEWAKVSGMQAVFRSALQVEIARALAISRERVMILNLRKDDFGIGDEAQESIVVDLLIRQPPLEDMEGEITAVKAFDLLAKLLDDPKSELRRNRHMAPYLADTDFREIPMTEDLLAKRDMHKAFENLRGQYNDTTACLLLTDVKAGITPCLEAHAGFAALAAMVLLLTA